MIKSKNLNIRVSETEHKEYLNKAAKSGKKLSELVRYLLREYKGE